MAPTRNHHIYRTPYGPLTITAAGDRVCRVALGTQTRGGEARPSAVTNECATQLLQYFSGKRTVFSIPLLVEGTEFQKQVWDAIADIPYGQTRTATDIAELIGSPQAMRSVGQAVNANPLVVLIPAHRVVPASGRVEPTSTHAQLRAAFRKLERSFSSGARP